MSKNSKKKGKKVVLIIIAMVIAIGLSVGGFFLYKSGILLNIFTKVKEEIKMETMYLASTSYEIDLYDEEYNKVTSLVRGTEVKKYQIEDITTEDGKIFNKIKIDNKDYLVEPIYIVKEYEECVQESEVFVRTSLTSYVDSESSKIAGYIKKGSALEVTGFDELDETGKVNMYKVKSGDNEVYVRSKYLVYTQEEANAVYNVNGTYDTHKDRKYYFELYGGSAANLDYYPYEKPTFEDNELKADSRTYYLVGTKYILGDVDKYINLAKSAGATAFVVDIKDGALAYPSEVAKEYSMSSYNSAMNTTENYKIAIDKIKAAGFYVIGRIVLFNDSTFAKDNPNDCIKTYYGETTTWVSAYSRRAWQYNVELARDAIHNFGFNEIQFDYVRFPESSYNWSRNNFDFRNTYGEEKAQAIQTFLFYATDEIHKENVYLSVDVFGESSSDYVTAYGQYWPAISNIVDVVSAMPYTDHFDRNNSDYWTNPYNTMYTWGLTAAARQKEIPTPAGVRTWITAYDTPYWNVTTVYGANEIIAQVQGLKAAGLGTGFITWNANSNYNKYSLIAPAFSKEY